ncbi:hypothetical protein D3C72_2203860 [compost metagenome]
MLLIVTFGRFTQQAVIPVAVGDLPCGIQIALFQIACAGINAHFRVLFFLRLFALNIHQPAGGTAAVQGRRGPFENIHALD